MGIAYETAENTTIQTHNDNRTSSKDENWKRRRESSIIGWKREILVVPVQRQ